MNKFIELSEQEKCLVGGGEEKDCHEECVHFSGYSRGYVCSMSERENLENRGNSVYIWANFVRYAGAVFVGLLSFSVGCFVGRKKVAMQNTNV